METIELQLTADLFKDVEFWSNDCPIGQAIKKIFPHKYTNVGISGMFIGETRLTSEFIGFDKPYDYSDFHIDMIKAGEKSYSSNEIIRTVKLIPTYHGKDNTEADSGLI
jgi:hypothetical protein